MSASESPVQDETAGAGVEETELLRTPLYDTHVASGARMVPFAGYEMPVSYPLGTLKEHLHVREKAGLFDVSHMGQAFLIPNDEKFETAAGALEAMAPGNFLGLKPGRQRYSQLMNESGGIVDDLMVSRLGLEGHQHWIYLVVNGACKVGDYALIEKSLPETVQLRIADNHALMALQGPMAARIMEGFAPELASLPFMAGLDLELADGVWAHVSRSGYTGEDGFEISVKNEDAVKLWETLTSNSDVEPIGLGARDSLRMEAGLCLYGHDIDETTSPIEAGLNWSVAKRRRENGGFPGAERVQAELKDGASRCLVGIAPQGRAPAREGTEILSSDGAPIGKVTSGGFSPSLGRPIAMGYVANGHEASGTKLGLQIRGKVHEAEVTDMPFVPHRYYRGG